ncbi:MAG: GNAT family N-acetyltransferase [Caldimonas sp.]
MASSDVLEIERLGQRDDAGGLALSDAVGWNQTADDWRLFIDAGQAVGCRDDAGVLVATAAALPYGDRVGWVSMILVADRFRHRGLASALLAECVAALAATNRVPVLDATPAGAQVYRRGGFVDGFAFERWEGLAPGAGPAAAASAVSADRGADPALATTVVALDAAATGVDRDVVLRAFLARPGTQVFVAPGDAGFALVRAGRHATQIGPLVAPDETQALALFERALAACAGRVYIDVPNRWRGLAGRLEALGFTRQRPFTRMARGATPALAADGQVFAVAGPEFG